MNQKRARKRKLRKDGLHIVRIESRIERVLPLPGESICWIFSLSDTRVCESGHDVVNCDDLGTIRDVWSGEVQKGAGCAANGRDTEPPPGWTVNTDYCNLRKVRRTNHFDALSGINEEDCEEIRHEDIHSFWNYYAGLEAYPDSIPCAQESFQHTGEDKTIASEEEVRSYVGGEPLLTDLYLALRIDPLALIRGFSEFITAIFGPAVTLAFPDPKVGT